jgi:ABC-type Fe2+-enterobactin transport system substrate-binding protein
MAPKKVNKMLRKESRLLNDREIPLRTSGDSAVVEHDKELADAIPTALKDSSLDTDHSYDKQLGDATRAELKVTWEVIDKANKELKQVSEPLSKTKTKANVLPSHSNATRSS